MSKHILLVDDDALLRRSLVFNLEQAGYRASSASTAEEALEHCRHDPPDLVLLDIGLPGLDGLAALREFKEDLALPVIFLTARRRELDEILGLELGADDYITKPFSVDVLLARIRALLRRSTRPVPQASPQEKLVVGDIEIDPAAHTVALCGQPVELAPRAFQLLHVLARSAGTVLTTEQLIDRVWGADYEGEPQVVYVYIRWLREKLEDESSNPQRIVTIRGVGYKLVPQPGGEETR